MTENHNTRGVDRECVVCGDAFRVRYPSVKTRMCSKRCQNAALSATQKSRGGDGGCDKCGRTSVEGHGNYKRCELHPFDRKRRVTDPIAVSTALAAQAGVKGTKGPLRDPCAHCGVPFRSYAKKLFCSMTCYIASGASAKIAKLNLERAVAAGRAPARERHEAICAHCGEPREVTKSSIGRYWNFCNRVCQRAFYSARFDAFIGNPESVALPQNFDEFLDRTELRCPIDRCDWSGKALSMHARMVHGVAADRFKQMLGFNLGTGLISKDLSAIHSDRARSLPDDVRKACVVAMRNAPRGEPSRYVSAENIEHRRKANAINPRPPRVCSEETKARIRAAKHRLYGPILPISCKACGAVFQPKTRRVVACSRRCTGVLSALSRAQKKATK